MPSGRSNIFISSVQKEFAEERKAIRNFVNGNRLLSRHFDVFLFEDLPAQDRRPDQLYLEKVERCSVFVSLFGKEYGWEDPTDGLSPSEREFDRATAIGKPRLVFLKNLGKDTPHCKMQELTARAKAQLKYQRFDDAAELTSNLYDSLVEFLEAQGIIQNKPFDAAVCPDLSLADIASKKIKWFVKTARQERNLNLPKTASLEEVLTHLRLLQEGKLANAAALLFANDPQRFKTTAVVKCAHYHGTKIAKPVPSYQVFDGTLFDQVDGAVDFVLSKLARQVGTRSRGAAAPVAYELPKEAIGEIIVNAVAHRDYTSDASVQVSVFADRVEVWNPGRLPVGLTPEDLGKPHSSEPANPFIAHPLYLAHYIESLGTGTIDVIRLCHESRLPLPDFAQRGNQFVVTVWRDWLTDEVLANLNLNDRQTAALPLIRQRRHLTNKEYQAATGATRPTAKRDLEDLVAKHVLVLKGSGRGAYYETPGKRLKNGSNGSSDDPSQNGS